MGDAKANVVRKTCKIVLRVEYAVTYRADSAAMEEPLLRDAIKDVLTAIPSDSVTASMYGSHCARRKPAKLIAVEGKGVPVSLVKLEHEPDKGWTGPPMHHTHGYDPDPHSA